MNIYVSNISCLGDVDSGVVTKPQEGLSPWIGYQEEEAMKAKVKPTVLQNNKYDDKFSI